MVADQRAANGTFEFDKVKGAPPVLNGSDPDKTNGVKNRPSIGEDPSRVIHGAPPRDLESPTCIWQAPVPTKIFPGSTWHVSAAQDIGNRRTQEDRFCIAPRLVQGQEHCSFFGVFDGTVGDFASDSIKDIIVPELMKSQNWQYFVDHVVKHKRELPEESVRTILEKAVKDMYLSADASLLWYCSQQGKHYATCTSVTAIIAGGYLAIAHLGDSKIIVGVEEADGRIVGEVKTIDHKPDMKDERDRIEAHGGSVEYLRNHQNKPFIRGGDFTRRKALGEQPMQIQYSRAFGGKDLKMFGLSNHPSVTIIHLKSQTRRIRWIVLASDGLWDVCDEKTAVEVVQQAQRDAVQNPTASGIPSPAQALVHQALAKQKAQNNNADNVTAVTVWIPPESMR